MLQGRSARFDRRRALLMVFGSVRKATNLGKYLVAVRLQKLSNEIRLRLFVIISIAAERCPVRFNRFQYVRSTCSPKSAIDRHSFASKASYRCSGRPSERAMTNPTSRRYERSLTQVGPPIREGAGSRRTGGQWSMFQEPHVRVMGERFNYPSTTRLSKKPLTRLYPS